MITARELAEAVSSDNNAFKRMSGEEQPSTSAQQHLLAAGEASPTANAAVEGDDLRHRHLYGVPRFSADFEEEYDERAAQWFELFVDLILVVAWTNVTDGLFESEWRTWQGLFYFWLTMNVVQSGWLMYMHYQSRFIDESFVHTIQLFVFILGLAGIAVHIGDPEFSTELSQSMVVQKVPLISMYAATAVLLKKARASLSIYAGILILSTLLSAAVAITGPKEYTPFAVGAWTVVVLIEATAPLSTVLLLDRSKIVPINIDHMVDRTNAFIMIVLGESLLSSMIKYGSIPGEARTGTFYACMSGVLLMAFSIGLLYYNVQPPRSASAFRRSHVRGFLVYFVTMFLSTAILLLSVGVKLCMHAITHNEAGIAPGDAWKMFGGLALVMHLIGWLRVGHYWGVQPAPSDSPFEKKVMYWWWGVFAAWPLVPMCIAAVAVGQEYLDPASMMGLASTVCLGLVLAETTFTTVLLNGATLSGLSPLAQSAV